MFEDFTKKAADLMNNENVKETINKAKEFVNSEKGREVVENVKEKAESFLGSLGKK